MDGQFIIETILVLLDTVRFVVVNWTVFNFVSTPLDGATTEFEDMVNFGFLLLKGDRRYQYRWNLAFKHKLLVYSSLPIFASIDQGGGYRSLSIIAKLVKFGVLVP